MDDNCFVRVDVDKMNWINFKCKSFIITSYCLIWLIVCPYYCTEGEPAHIQIKRTFYRSSSTNNVLNTGTEDSIKRQQKVLLVSIDGYRWDLNKITKTPNIDLLMKNGVTVDHVLNVFPTKTLPNHHSIVTGLYPENHGMVDNAFMETKNGKRFDMSKDDCMEDASWWNQSLPLWIDVQRKTKYKSGNMFWPGNKVPYGDKNETAKYQPSKVLTKLYEKKALRGKNMDIFYEILVDEVIRWLLKDDISFVTLYTEELDYLLHENGVEHDIICDGMKMIDKFVGRIYKKITEDDKLKDNVNAIFVGDHGHVTTSFDRLIEINNFFDIKNDVIAIYGITDVFIYTKPGKKEKVYRQLKKASDKDTRFQVFLREKLPSHMHLNSTRTGDILVLPIPGWIVVDKTNLPYYLKKDKWIRAEHGYDNLIKDMNPGFFAFGPMFREGYEKNSIEIVDIYSLICHILGMKPSKHDGSFERVKPFLKEFEKKKNETAEENGAEELFID